MYAEKEKIEWLLFESGMTIKEVHKLTELPRQTVSDLMKRKSSIDEMRFKNAAKLTTLAVDLLDQEKKGSTLT